MAQRVITATGSEVRNRDHPLQQGLSGRLRGHAQANSGLGKIRNLLGFEPKRNLDTILADVIAEFKAGQAICASNEIATTETRKLQAERVIAAVTPRSREYACFRISDH